MACLRGGARAMTDRQPTVLHEDSRLIAVAKESGELVHNSAFAGPRELSLRQRVGKVIGSDVFPLHRLDRGTSGVVLFAKARADVSALSAELQAGEKRYVAIVRGHFVGAAWIDHPLSQDDGDAKSAQTACRSLACSRVERMSAVEVVLVTGRLHQVRRHLKHLHHPLIGDVKYGKGPFNRLARERYGLHRLALHAVSIRLRSGLQIDSSLDGELAATWRTLFHTTAATRYSLLGEVKNA